MFDFFVKLIGSGIAGIIFFTPVIPELKDETLFIETTLTEPVTEDIHNLIIQGYEFNVEFYISVIVDKKKVYKRTFRRVLSYNDNWIINDEIVDFDQVQERFGLINITFEDINISDGDEIVIFVKAKIVNDFLFEKSTGLKTEILWENYIPRIKKVFKYTEDRFVDM